MRIKLGNYIPLLVIVGLIAYVFAALADPSRGRYAPIVTRLQSLHTVLARDALSARHGRSNDYSSIVWANEEVNVNSRLLRGLLSDDDDDVELSTVMKEYFAATDELVDHIEAFKTSNAVDRNSARYVPDLTAEVISQAGDADRKVISLVERLLQSMLIFDVDRTKSSQEAVYSHIHRLTELASARPNQAELLMRLGDHVRKVVDTRPVVEAHLDAIVTSPATRLLNQALLYVSARNEQGLRHQQVLQQAFAVLSASLIGYVATAFWQLRHAVKELDDANSSLEQITDQRAKELEVKSKELMQAQRLESIGQLAAGIAHEINTPMQFVNDNIHFLDDCCTKLFEVVDAYEHNLTVGDQPKSWQERRDELDEVMQRNQFERIREHVPQAIAESVEGIGRVINIVRAMKEFSHPGREPKVGVDLNNAVQSTVTITRNQWKYVADMELDLDPDLPTVSCTPAEINQVLLNLIVNAADAIMEKVGDNTGEKGTITVRTRSTDGAISVEVEDTGCGVPEDIRNRIFDPFFTTKDVGKGTGQGLSICYDVIVNKHAGSLEVNSTLGQGSTFRIAIPHQPLAATADSPVEASVEVNPDDTESLLPASIH